MAGLSLANTANHLQAQVANAPTSINLNDGNVHTAKIQYSPAPSGTFIVSVDGIVQVSGTVTDAAMETIAPEGLAYLGWTAAISDGRTANIDIDQWRLWTVGASGPRSRPTVGVPTPTAASNIKTTAGTFVLQVNDACGDVYNRSATGVNVFLSLRTDAVEITGTTETVDNGDGTYEVCNATARHHLTNAAVFDRSLTTTRLRETTTCTSWWPTRTLKAVPST